MKIVPGIWLAIGFLLLEFSSCRNPCKGVQCFQGECADGICVCESGFEGIACNQRITTTFNGNFSLTEDCNSPGTDPYLCEITNSETDSLQFVFNNLFNSGFNIEAALEDDGTSFVISSQSFGTGTLNGDGSINSSGTEITLSYHVNLSTGIYNCNATLVRQ